MAWLRCLVVRHQWQPARWAMDVAAASLSVGYLVAIADVEACSRCGRWRRVKR